MKSNFSKQRAYQYGCWLSVWIKNLTGTAQECYELYRKNARGTVLQNSNYTVTYLPSLKPSKKDEQDMQDSAGEIRKKPFGIYSSSV